MTSLNKKLLVSVTAIIFATGCGGGMSANSGGDNNNGYSSPEFDNLKLDGAVKEGKYEDQKLVSVDKEKKELVVQLPTLALPVMVGNLGQAIPVPKLSGTTMNLEVAADGNLTLVLRIPLSLVMRGASFLGNSERLPNGDVLPAIPDGELPGVAVDLNSQGSVKGYLYLGKATIGAFVTTPFNPMVSMQLPIYQNNGAVLGYLTTVPDKNTSPGGIFMSVKLPADIARIIDDVL
jgi:hypothetical protein